MLAVLIQTDMLDSEKPDLVVLDILLGAEDMNGLDVCNKIRQKGLHTPVIFLTIKDRIEDPWYMERAFRLGGDDYVSKREELRRLEQELGLRPAEFLERKSDVEELIARISARLPQVEAKQEFDGYLRVDISWQKAHLNLQGEWQEVHLTNKEFALLETVMQATGRPVGKTQLMDGAGVDGESSLQNHIWRLRNKLEPDPENPHYILTCHKIGYRFRTLP